MAGPSPSGAGPSEPSQAPAVQSSDRSQGVVLDGLEPGGATCPGGYAVRGRPGLCSHGPDPADAGIDVRRPRTTTELEAAMAEDAGLASTDGSVPCYGDGETGNRVQAVYVHAADVADRYDSVAPLIRQWAASVDAVFADSAAETGGVRHVRWVTDPSCELSVARVEVPTTGDDSYADTAGNLEALGFDRADRKYVMWVDANVYCGIGGFINDDRASARNANNAGQSYARVDTGCWGLAQPVEAHELMHTMGGVQASAPHSTGGGHCTDDYDRMCYQDGWGITMTYPCASSHERLFDCGHDDYFSTNPLQGNYLSNHWNAASSAFLEKVEPAPPTTGTNTTTWSGSLSRKAPTKTYSLPLGDGSITLALSDSSTTPLRMTLQRMVDGVVVADVTGPSILRTSAAVSAGAYEVTVSGSGSIRFNLTADFTS